MASARLGKDRRRIFVLVAVEEAAAAFLAAVIRTFAAGADCSGQLTEALCCRQRQPRGARQPAAGGGWRPAAGSARPRRSDPPRAGPSAWRVASQAAAATVAPPAVSSTAPPRSPSLPAPPRPTQPAPTLLESAHARQAHAARRRRRLQSRQAKRAIRAEGLKESLGGLERRGPRFGTASRRARPPISEQSARARAARAAARSTSHAHSCWFSTAIPMAVRPPCGGGGNGGSGISQRGSSSVHKCE